MRVFCSRESFARTLGANPKSLLVHYILCTPVNTLRLPLLIVGNRCISKIYITVDR